LTNKRAKLQTVILIYLLWQVSPLVDRKYPDSTYAEIYALYLGNTFYDVIYYFE